jgi:hypothetical protein
VRRFSAAFASEKENLSAAGVADLSGGRNEFAAVKRGPEEGV